MPDLKIKTNKVQLKSALTKAATIAIAAIVAFMTIPVIHKQATTFGDERQKEKDAHELSTEIYINNCLLDAENGDYIVARTNLLRKKPGALNKRLRTKWYVAMTSIYHAEAKTDKKNRMFLVMNALNFAEKGKKSVENREAMDNLEMVQAKLYMLNNQWEKASELLRDLETRSRSPHKRWLIRMEIAHCYKMTRKNIDAINILSTVIEETDDDDIWAESIRRKSDLYWEMSIQETTKQEYRFNPEKNYLTDTVKATMGRYSYSFKALKGYNEIIDTITVNYHPEKMKALEKVLEIHVNNGDVNQAYFIANLIKRTSADRPYSAAAYHSMAELEMQRHNLNRTSSFIKRLIKIHPESHHTHIAVKRYYNELKKAKLWDQLFSLSKKAVHTLTFQDLKIAILRDLLLGQKNLLSHINIKNPKVAKEVEAMLNKIDSKIPAELSVLNFAKASFYYSTGQYYKADVEFSNYLINPLYEEFIELSHYYYLVSAVKSQKPAVIRSLRAKLFLNNTYDNNHSQDVMLYLMSAYYDMGLWNESIDAAMKVFVNEIVRMGKQHENYQANPQWLKAVARIGQSYEKTDRIKEAEKVFSTWADEFTKSPYAASIYQDWANLAASKKRHKESIRRFNLIIPHLKDQKDFLTIISLRNVQKLKSNDPNARKEAQVLLKRLPMKVNLLGQQSVEELEEQIHKALLENYIASDPDNIEKIFEQVFLKYQEKEWPYELAIKWLQININEGNYKKAKTFAKKSLLGPLSALKEENVRNAIKKQTLLLMALESENVF
jgi:hypothetical protein